MNFKFIVVFSFILIAFNGASAELSKSTNQDIQQFYRLKKEMASRPFPFYSIKNKMIEYYTNSDRKSKTPLLKRLKDNSLILESNPTDYVTHALVSFELLMERNERLEMTPLMHGLERKIKLIKDRDLLIFAENTLAGYYFFLNNFQEARLHNFKALKLSKEIRDTMNYQINCYNIGISYSTEGDYKRAETYLKKSIYFEQFGFKDLHCDNLLAYADLLDNQGKHHEAIAIYEDLKDQIPDSDKAVYFCNLGSILLSISEFEKAEQALLTSERIMLESKADHVIEEVYTNLAECYSKTKNFEKSYNYLVLKDSAVAAQKKAENIAELGKLKKQDLIKIQMLQKKNAQEKLEHEKTKTLRLIFSLIFVVVLLTSAIVFVLQLRSKNKALVRLSLDKMKQEKHLENESISIQSVKKVSSELVEKFEKLLFEKELFKDPDLTVQKLAKKMGTNVKDLSQTINGHYGTPFRTLINDKRIELAKHMLIDEKYTNYSMVGIAETVGYANKSTFFKHFKEITGVTPSNFQTFAKVMLSETEKPGSYDHAKEDIN